MLRSRVRKSADFFSNMAEAVESTSAEFVNNQPDSQSSTERKIIKAEVKSLTFKTIKQQIGKCTLCIRTPSADLIQLPACQCFFCRSCFITFLNNFATPRPVLTKETISISFFKRNKRKKISGQKLFDGLFDADCLSPAGDVLPKPIKPTVIKSTKCLEDSYVRQRRHCVDKEFYRLTRVEEFECPNCHHWYGKFNRLDLPRNRVVSDIIKLMDEESSVVS